ncbi:DUF2950 domain-containing protein [Enterobacteriaceae bacterium H20N1]|uniref:DUF2950 domain-containing protein n=1 Tax=Dryocola boscaweniae TaxID=2925397 RepID=A0A9X2W8T6_9ENTR|nr:DUF2950 domain-containing protein [Dryocola boscaweniae]MCT4702945.1 DUF2950 domain-containing protein [Dryocola boscaweniae]MCT4720113.1 DUF2950 domain-containing protein [Dryocola boscaweniae]
MKKYMALSIIPLLMMPFFAQAQQIFTSPEQASTALFEAIKRQDDAALTSLLGDNWRDLLPPEGADPAAVARFLRDWDVRHHVEQQDNVAHLNVGKEDWQLPLPMVKTDKGWHFNMQGAADEILTRTIGRNELAAIEAAHAYVQAQQDYFQLNQAYAQKFISSEGKKDGLYWPARPGEAPSPLGPAFSPAQPGMGYHGYHFRILKAQGADAEGGEKQYLNNGKMTDGFALVAWPVTYGETGIATFIVDEHDRVYQADLGEESAKKAQSLTEFEPGDGWQAVTP